ncbi:MAG: HAD hydrolase-like protein [Omnitrophica WOR_2 bacterium]
MKFSNLFFDLDGTLIDSKRGIFNAVKYTIDKMGLPEADRPYDLNPFIGPPLRESFKNLFNFSDSVAETATSIYREYYGDKGLYEFDIYPGISKIIPELSSRGFLISLVTSKAEIYAEKIINSTSFKDCFNTISGCEINGLRSSKQELIKYTLHKLKINPSEAVLMIGDRYHDIQGAKNTGISSAAVLYGYGSKEELEKELPDILIPTTSDLLSLLCQ